MSQVCDKNKFQKFIKTKFYKKNPKKTLKNKKQSFFLKNPKNPKKILKKNPSYFVNISWADEILQ